MLTAANQPPIPDGIGIYTGSPTHRTAPEGRIAISHGREPVEGGAQFSVRPVGAVAAPGLISTRQSPLRGSIGFGGPCFHGLAPEARRSRPLRGRGISDLCRYQCPEGES